MNPPAAYFRAGVGAVIADARGFVLALERADVPGAWQLPQGGLEAGEEPADAIVREILEETGIPLERLRLLDRYPEPLAYELPPEARSPKTGRGQVQYWFLFRYLGGGEAGVRLAPGGEFRAWAWLPLEKVVDDVVAFRKSVYRHLHHRFGPRIVPAAG